MHKQKDNLFSLLMILLILVIVGFFIYNFIYDVNVFKTKKDETIFQSDIDKYILSSLPNDPVKGDHISSVVIYLFADYESDGVQDVVNIINDLIEKYPDQVHLVWKDFPLPKNYFARGAALAARCALDEDKYWEYNEKLLNRKESLSLDLYQNIAQELEINLTSFLSCYKSGQSLYDIENNVREAYVLDVSEVPSIFINQEQIEGKISFEKLDKIISNLVK